MKHGHHLQALGRRASGAMIQLGQITIPALDGRGRPLKLPGEVAGPGVVGFQRGRRHRRGEGVLQERGLGLAERLLIGRFQGGGFGFLHLGLPVDDGEQLLLEPTLGRFVERQRS